jgi:Holliday junction resolvase
MKNDILAPNGKSSTRRKKTREASFWQAIKKALRENFPDWSATRLESRATLGVPDVLILDSGGKWHMVELKTTASMRVDLTPHQVAFLTKHARGSCWIAVKLTGASGHEVFLYKGDQAVEVKLEGLRATPTKHFSTPVNYRAVLTYLTQKG